MSIERVIRIIAGAFVLLSLGLAWRVNGVQLFAGLMPVPGGMGVAEAGYTAGLQAIGIPSSVAISTAIAMRLVTFYLPPIWGAPAMGWLRRRDYV